MTSTTLKVGFDGKAVKTGLAGIGTMFSKFGKQIAIGATRRVGEGMTDWVGKLITAIPQAMNETMQWAGSLVDLSAQTRMTVKDLMILNTAFANAGMESVDAGRMISNMQKAIYEAGHGGQNEQNWLSRLGLSPKSFEGMDPIDRLKLLMTKIKEMDAMLAPGERDEMTSAFFGGKMGVQALKIVDNWAASMAEAKAMLGDMTDLSKEQLGYWDQLGDLIATRFSLSKYRAAGSLLTAIFGKDMKTGLAAVNNLFDGLDSIGPKLAQVGVFLKPVLDLINQIILDIKRMGFKDFFSTAFESMGPALERAGEWIGTGFMKTVRGQMSPSGGMGGAGGSSPMGAMILESLKTLLVPFAGTSGLFTQNDPAKLLMETQEQTDILNRIYAKNPTAIFA